MSEKNVLPIAVMNNCDHQESGTVLRDLIPETAGLQEDVVNPDGVRYIVYMNDPHVVMYFYSSSVSCPCLMVCFKIDLIS